MIKNEPFWYIVGVVFLYSIFDIKKQYIKVKQMKKEGLNYVYEHHILWTEIGVIISGILLFLNEMLLLIGW